MASQPYANGFFDKMMQQAMDEITSGKSGWRECDTNTLLLACLGNLANKFQCAADQMTKQQKTFFKLAWFFAGIVATTVIGYFIIEVFNL